MDTYDNCLRCKKGLECGWSFIEPNKPIDRKKMVDEPCDNYCKPSTFTVADLDTDATINLMVAIVDAARDDMEKAIFKKRTAEQKIKALNKIIDKQERVITEVQGLLPRKARIIIGKNVKERFKKVDNRHYGTTEEFIAKLYARIERLEADVLDLSAERRAILDSLTSCVASFSQAPGGSSDPHAYDDYAAISAELDAKIDEIVDTKMKIECLQKRKNKC